MIGFILIFVGNNKPCGLINKRLKACYLLDFNEGLWFTVRLFRKAFERVLFQMARGGCFFSIESKAGRDFKR